MPYYRCIIPKDSLTFEQRQDIALAFTDIHCGNTGAPRSFVSVAFFETPEGEESEFGSAYYLDGGNRAGRPEEVKQQAELTNRQSYANSLMTSDRAIKTGTADTHASSAVNSEKVMAHRWATFNSFSSIQ